MVMIMYRLKGQTQWQSLPPSSGKSNLGLKMLADLLAQDKIELISLDLELAPSEWKQWCEKLGLKPYPYPEEQCPGHVASANDNKVCGRCGIHINSLRPDDDD